MRIFTLCIQQFEGFVLKNETHKSILVILHTDKILHPKGERKLV